MRRQYEECAACYGYASWESDGGVGIFPGLGCLQNCDCPLFRKYVHHEPVTPSEQAMIQNEYSSIGRRLEVLRRGSSSEQVPEDMD